MRIAILAVIAIAGRGAEFDHSAWDRILEKHVNAAGEFDYTALKAAPAGFEAYVRRIEAASPDNRKDLFPGKSAELAYWLNAYNASVIKAVLAAYPVRGVRDLGSARGFFDRREHRLGGKLVSLIEIEDRIRARYADPRIHFALVCASISCPRLDRTAFRGATLDAHLDQLTRRFLGERRNLAIDPARRSAELSAILDWYKEDFRPNLTAFLARYGVKLPPGTTFRYRAYDWSLNDRGSRARSFSPLERELSSLSKASP